ncbi:glycoside hydrolase family 3 N-terminal domain-containing protein [uncultured Bacteroides sp.]|uniref:glycoside hydrolase family 3 N-terminal domain-containing protein n=1 Tax=uncultured Bacteroides sp. TaxID=162156 RepID=UPI0025E8A968|nr:glycoside hydrolase family 3 N-terminal domain-containing protein [uncultured Bacteroides sp.]
MKKLLTLILCLCTFGVTTASPQNSPKDKFVSKLLKQMTLDEKIGQLAQCTYRGNFTGPDGGNLPKEEYVKQGKIGSMLNVIGIKDIRRYQELALQSRLRIPLIFGLDVIHGYRTGFPLPLAEAASFDLEMIEEAARYNALESAADGLNWVFAPMVDISWDARWGRVMEGAGEDPYYGSRVAEARIRGLQGSNLADTATVMACVKHFAGYGAPIAGKEYNSVDMSLGQFANFYMPPYQAAIQAGAATVMSAFNDFNNIPCTANDFLLNQLLRKKWSFKGFVVSDYNSVEELVNHRYASDKKDAAAKALNAGLDMEMVSTCYLTYLKELIQEGKVKESVLDNAVRRILEKKYELGLFEDPFRYCNPARSARVLNSPEVRNASLRMAERSIVLLENKGSVLPLAPQIKSVALIGGLTKSQWDMAGAWAAMTDRNKIVTLHDALQQKGLAVNYADGYDLKTNRMSGLQEAIQAANASDIIIVAIGEKANQSGEKTSKVNISLPEEQQKLVAELKKTGKPVIVLVMCGRPVIFNEAREHADAVLCTWWLGSEAGNAIYNVLWGKYNPSAKLPMTFPAHVGQIPIHYQQKSTGRPTSLKQAYTASYIDSSTEPAYYFGHGLSYTTFGYSNLNVKPGKTPGIHALVSVKVTNQGLYAGEEVVQLYVQDKTASVTRPIKELKGIRKIKLEAGESQTVTFSITDEALGFYDNDMNYKVEPGDFIFMVGGSSNNLQQITFALKEHNSNKK